MRVCLHVCTCLSLGIHFLVGAWGGVRGLHAGWLGSVVHQLGSWGHLHRQGLAGREKSVHKQERRLYVVVLQLHRVAPYTESPYGPCSLHPTPPSSAPSTTTTTTPPPLTAPVADADGKQMEGVAAANAGIGCWESEAGGRCDSASVFVQRE